MKSFTYLVLPLALALVVSVGCRPENMKNIHGYPPTKGLTDAELHPPFDTNALPDKTEGIAMSDPSKRADWVRNRAIFKKDTVYFDYDSSVIKAGEKPKVTAVAEYLKAHPGHGLEIEGHCDERGTEEYNRSLGDRRAMALREEVARNGVDPMMIDTVSFGKDRPAMPGHDELAHRKNRRGEFLLETSPAAK